MNQFHWLLCIVVSPRKSWHCDLCENVWQKQNWIAKSTNLKENAGKIKSIFAIRTALWGKKLGGWLEYCRSWKVTLGTLEVAVKVGDYLIQFWIKVVLVMVEICVLCYWWFSNQFDIVLDTPYSCDTVGYELYTLLAAMPWNELEHRWIN